MQQLIGDVYEYNEATCDKQLEVQFQHMGVRLDG
jgi:hypothetical protein